MSFAVNPATQVVTPAVVPAVAPATPPTKESIIQKFEADAKAAIQDVDSDWKALTTRGQVTTILTLVATVLTVMQIAFALAKSKTESYCKYCHNTSVVMGLSSILLTIHGSFAGRKVAETIKNGMAASGLTPATTPATDVSSTHHWNAASVMTGIAMANDTLAAISLTVLGVSAWRR